MGKNSQAATATQKKAMLRALEANFGNVNRAAKSVKMNASTHYRWLKEDQEYAEQGENMRDLCYRKVKDSLLENALKRIEKGDSAVLNKMLGIFFKNLPEEMKMVRRYNDVPFRMKIRVAPHPSDMFSDDPMTQLAVKAWEEEEAREKELREGRQA